MTCPLCGLQFSREEAGRGCESCALRPLKGGCGMMRCPNCGYEIPEEPPIVKAIKRWIRKRYGGKRIA